MYLRLTVSDTHVGTPTWPTGTWSLPTSGLRPDLKEGTWSFLSDSNPDSRTLTQSLWYQIMYLSGKNRK